MEFFLDSINLIKWGLLSGMLLGLSISFTSPFLILKRNALFPHALTHIYFLAVIITSLILNNLPFFSFLSFYSYFYPPFYFLNLDFKKIHQIL